MIKTYLGLFLRVAVTTIALVTLLGAYLEYSGAKWVYEEDIQLTRGYLVMLSQAYESGALSSDEFEQHYSDLLGFPVVLRDKADVDDIELSYTSKGVLVDVEEDVFYWLPQSDADSLLLSIEPYAGTGDAGNNFVIFLIVCICAVSVFIWCWPLLRRLGRLKAAVDEFAQGHFSVRVLDKNKDEVNKIMMSFNAMAAQIGVLLDQQKTANQAFSHEIRTPLSRIKMLAYDMPEDKKASLQEEVNEIDYLVGEVLAYSDIQAVNEKTQQHWFAIIPWLEANFSEWMLPEGVAYTTDWDENLNGLQIWGSESQLELLIGNLLLNASHYAASHIAMCAVVEEKHCVISVADDGCGVPAPLREKIFSPFSRADSSRSRETGGSGMGLAIAHKIASYHNAELSCSESEVLGGACFVLRIPVQ